LRELELNKVVWGPDASTCETSQRICAAAIAQRNVFV
jgi:hypothetical protein